MKFFSKKSKDNRTNKTAKKVLVVTGMMLALFMAAPVANNSVIDNVIGVETAYAAETYSDNWKMDSNGTWWYYMEDGSVAKDAWVKDHGEWYLLSETGAMRTGLFKSNDNKYYLLDTVRGTGTYGKLLKNGSVYNGVTLKCDTSEAYEGALSQETINALQSIGLDFNSAPNVENTQHVENGKVTSGGNTTQNTTTNQSNGDMWHISAGGTGYTGSTSDLPDFSYWVVEGHVYKTVNGSMRTAPGAGGGTTIDPNFHPVQ